MADSQPKAAAAPKNNAAPKAAGPKAGLSSASALSSASKAAKMNPINQIKCWADHCDKEIKSGQQWFQNWGEVYFPGQKMDDRIEQLHQRAAHLSEVGTKAREERDKISLESFDSPHRVSTSTLLKAAYPF